MGDRVRQLRLVVEAAGYEGGLAFCRHLLGLVEEESHRDGDARVCISEATQALRQAGAQVIAARP